MDVVVVVVVVDVFLGFCFASPWAAVDALSSKFLFFCSFSCS